MIDPKNCWTGTCGVVADPELVNDNILKLRVALDYAGSEKGSTNTSGYFDVVYYLNGDENPRNAKFVRGQVEAGNIKKGSQIQILGRLVQDRWTVSETGKGASRVTIVAESLTYAGGNRPASDDNTASASSSKPASLPTEF